MLGLWVVLIKVLPKMLEKLRYILLTTLTPVSMIRASLPVDPPDDDAPTCANVVPLRSSVAIREPVEGFDYREPEVVKASDGHYDFTDPKIRFMVRLNHNPHEIFLLGGDRIGPNCRDCGRVWPCPAESALREFYQVNPSLMEEEI